MAINPFMAPAVAGIHGLSSIEDLIQLYVSAHLMTGHATGFGKLVDEKILPRVFGSSKLDASYRRSHPPYSASRYNEIDHVITLPGSELPSLLSLKASRWTIQLTMAVQLNAAFNEILETEGDRYDDITVGVYYGRRETLTDKYDILRGINRGAKHDVHDLTARVSVLAGVDFWAWLNGGERLTQQWVLKGITEAVRSSQVVELSKNLIRAFERKIADNMRDFRRDDDVAWEAFLTSINGS